MIGVYSVDDVTLTRTGALDEWNEPGTDTTETLSGYLEWKESKILNIEGEEVDSKGTFLITYDNTITLRDTLTIDGVKWPIIAIRRDQDFSPVSTRLFL